MTQELLEKANDINHDIKVLKDIKSEQDKRHWVGFRTPLCGEVSSFWINEIQDDFKRFIAAELEKAEKMLERLQ